MARTNIWKMMRDALRSAKSSKHRSRRPLATRLALEQLESRELLSVSRFVHEVGEQRVVIYGTSEADQITISMDSASVVRVRAQSVGGLVEETFQRSAVNSLSFYGYSGNDRFDNQTAISSRGYGGDGDDILLGGSGADEFYGGDGNDQLNGRGGNDRLLGEVGADTLTGGDGDDELLGQDGNDWMDGGAGNDKLVGGIGDETLYGGFGNDVIYGEDGHDRIFGQDGNDWIDGGIGSDTVYGGLGDDDISGGDGDDVMFGDAGDDELTGEAGDDWADGGSGIDRIVGGLGHDVLYGGSEVDTIFGDEGNDTLHGQDGDDYLDGGSGNDQISGDAGADYMLGGLDDDGMSGGDGQDEIYGREGNDWIDGGADSDVLGGGLGNDTIYGGLGNDNIRGNEGDDFLVGQGGDDYLDGDIGKDWLYGSDGDDYLAGGGDDDFLVGGDGNDEVHGQDGDDWADGSAGRDKVTGGLGNDTLYGGAENDNLYGESGDDVINGQNGDDWIDGGDDHDTVDGRSGDDYLQGGTGNDVLAGGDGNDRLNGNGDNDLVVGGAGSDEIHGSAGEDILIGGTTAYTSDDSAAQAILTVWGSTLSYASRVALLQSDSFSAHLKSEQTVFDDGVSDQIFGEEGQDWLIQTGFMGTWDPNQSEDSGQGHNSGGHSHNVTVLDEPPALEGFALVDSLDKLNDRESTETLTSLVPHANDATLQREHLTLFELVRYDQVTHYAVTDGAWSDPNTWQNGQVPSNGARVLIPINVTVTVDRVLTVRPKTVRVDGTLSFSATANSELRVDTIVVSATGSFEMGTSWAPIPASFKARLVFTNDGPIDRVADPFAIGRGLISHGSVSMYGAEVATSIAVVGSVVAGSNVVNLATLPTGWKVGDTIVLAGTSPDTNEARQISAIAGNNVFVSQAFSHNHVPAAGFQVHVANTTRNVVIESEASAFDRRGHVMFMHNRDVHIANVGFYQLGRTNKSIPINDPVVDANWQLQSGTGTNARARYSVHFHRNGLVNDSNPSTVMGSAVVDSPGWGFVNHSSYVDIIDNVAFRVNGAAFASEVGDEIGTFANNIAIGTTGSGEGTESRSYLQDFGHQGDGFWFQGPGITVTGNVSAGNEGNALILYARALIEGGTRQKFISANLVDPSIANGATEIDTQHVPILRFDNNVGYGSATGLGIWYHLRDATHNQQGVFKDSVFWSNFDGSELLYSHKTILRNLTFIGTSATQAGGIGIDMNIVTRDITYQDMRVSNFYRGIVVPRQGYAIIIGGILNNYDDVLIRSGISADRYVFLGGTLQLSRLVMSREFNAFNGNADHVFLTDRIYLNYGSFNNQRVYYHVQHPTAVPFPAAIEGIPASYVDKTSQQLKDQYGKMIGGELAPANAVEVPGVYGLVVPSTTNQSSSPQFVSVQHFHQVTMANTRSPR